MRPGYLRQFFTAALSVITAGFIPRRKVYQIPVILGNQGVIFLFYYLVQLHLSVSKRIGY